MLSNGGIWSMAVNGKIYVHPIPVSLHVRALLVLKTFFSGDVLTTDETFGEGDDAFDTLFSEKGAGDMFHARSLSISNHGCGWCGQWHVQAALVPRAADLWKGGRRRHFQRGRCTIGKEIVDRVLDRRRKSADDSTRPDNCTSRFGGPHVWRWYWALISGGFFRNVCPSNTGSVTTAVELTDLTVIIDTRPGETFVAVIWTSSTHRTHSCTACSRSSSSLDGISPCRRCAVRGRHWALDELHHLPAHSLHALQLL